MIFEDNKKQFVAAGAVVVVSLGAYFLFARPEFMAAVKAREQERSLDEAIQKSTLAVDEMTTLISATSNLEEFSIQSDADILPKMLESIATEGEHHGVNVISMRPSAAERVEIAGGGVVDLGAESTRLVVAVTVEARCQALGAYLHALESIPVLVAVRNLRIERIGKDSALVRASFDIETYSIRTNHEKTE